MEAGKLKYTYIPKFKHILFVNAKISNLRLKQWHRTTFKCTRCPNGEFRLCCLYSRLCPFLSLLSPPSHSPFPVIPSFPPYPLLPPLSLSFLFPVPEPPHPFSLFSFYCFCLSASLCVRESLIGASGLLHVKYIYS